MTIADCSKLLESLATIAWPAIVVLVVVRFQPAVAAIIESAKSRKFTVKIGGQELSMDEANAQQQSLIADIQAQIVELKKQLSSPLTAPPAQPVAATEKAVPSRPRRILWVDDDPKNNSYFVEQLTKAGVTVETALSTSDALALFAKGKYSHIISDMGRRESGRIKPDAGLDFLKAARPKDPDVPIVIFCSARRAREYGDEARQLGATAVTSSPTTLSGLLHLDELKAEAG